MPPITTRSNTFEENRPSGAARAARSRGRTARRSTTCARGSRAGAAAGAPARAVVPGWRTYSSQASPMPASDVTAPTISASASSPPDTSVSAKRESSNVGSQEVLDHVRHAGDLEHARDHRQHGEDAHRDLHRPPRARRCGARGRGSRRRCPPARRSVGLTGSAWWRCPRSSSRASSFGSPPKTRNTIRNA